MYRVGIITSSDKGSRGEREDKGGPLIKDIVLKYPEDFEVAHAVIVPDERDQLSAAMIYMADVEHLDLVITTGGTGFSKRDVTPEATLDVVDRRTTGITIGMMNVSMQATMRGMLSRAESGIRGETLIVNLPGSPKAIEEILVPILPSLKHGLDMINGVNAEHKHAEKN